MNSQRNRLLFRLPWINDASEIHAVVFHGLVIACYASAFAIYLNHDLVGISDGYSLLAFIGGAAILLGWISGVDVGVNFHNHCHRPIFRYRWLNRWFGRLWTVSGGWPAYFWSYAHLTVHHKQLLEEDDWTLPRRRPNGQWENFFTYCLAHWPWRYAYQFALAFQSSRCGPKVTCRAVSELLFFLLVWSIPFWIDWRMALGLWLLPQWLANVAVMGPGMYAQHAGREKPGRDHRFRHSTTFVSRFFNLTMFNIGYHAEHHTFPSVHWSELPSVHEQVKDEMIGEGAHVVPYGYYHGGYLLARNRESFEDQHPQYRNRSTDAEALK